MLIPSIDLLSAHIVRLVKGDYNRVTEYKNSTPVDQVRIFVEKGYRRIHVVDLDGARKGSPCNLDALREMATVPGAQIEWGGGIATSADLRAVFDAGAAYAVIGSVAAREPERFIEWLEEFGPERIILGADVRRGRVAVSGWTATLDISIDSLLNRFLPHGLTQAIVTDISRDGTLKGPSTALYLDLQARYPQVEFTVSGGIALRQDIDNLQALGLNRIIVGKAYYEGKIKL